jgi:hypothetical protein
MYRILNLLRQLLAAPPAPPRDPLEKLSPHELADLPPHHPRALPCA